MRRIARATTYLLAVGVMWAMASAPRVHAANLQIDDSVEGKITLNHDANWESGVNSNGTPFAAFVSGSTTVSGETATFTGTWIAPGAGVPNPGTGIVYFVERHNHNLVSDTITASWSGDATITFTVQSSPAGSNLGPLPAAFAGLGIVEAETFVELVALFRDPMTAAPVSIPSNLTVQFESTAAPASAPAFSRYALSLAALLLLSIGLVALRARPATPACNVEQ